ncbi:MAG TPA: outer membrane protein transport protein [Candidatus Binatia bacterium]
MFLSGAQADGFRNPFQSAGAIAQGNAFAAQADNASAVFYNPAGMTQLHGIQFLGGVEFVNVHTHFESPDGSTTHNELGGPFGMPPPGQLFLTAKPKDLGVSWLGDLSVGLGLQNLFGFASKYPVNGPLQTAITSAALPLLDIKPTFAYRFSNWLSLGVGADVFTFWDSVLGGAKQKFISPGLPGMPAGSHVTITGSGTTAAVNTSALLTLLSTDKGDARVNLGFVWRSHSKLSLDGDLRVNNARVASAHSSIHFPDIFTVGVAVWPQRTAEHEWKVESDVDYVRWSELHNLDFEFSNGVTLTNPQDWSDAISVGVGTEYKWLNLQSLPNWDLALRAGYLWSMTPVPDKNFNPAFPDSNVHVLSFGIGLTCHPGAKFLGFKDCGRSGETIAEMIGVDLAYQLFLFESRTVTGNPNPAVNGTYDTINQALALTFRVGF